MTARVRPATADDLEPLYEMAKRATDPDAGVAPPEEPEN